MANIFKKLFNKEKWESFLYTDEDDYDDDDFYDDYIDNPRVPIFDLNNKEPEIDFVDVETGEEIDYIPVESRNTQSIKYQRREKQLTREQRALLFELQSQMDYEFVMNGYITQEKVHEIFGLDDRAYVKEEEDAEEI